MSAPRTHHRQQRRRSEEVRQATNREPAFECTLVRVVVSVRSKGRTDGKSACHLRCSKTVCNTHDRTCTDRTKTRDFKIENQRQESKSMNHFKSRTKTRDTRPNPNHWCESMPRTENRAPQIIANTTCGHATRPPTRITGADQ